MSDISIPGFSNQNSTIDTEQIIADLIEVERIPIERVESRIDSHQTEREIWLDLGRRITRLADNASFLFSFQNPFSDRIGISSNDRAIVLTPARGAEESEHEIEIIQNAGRDRFQSNLIPDTYQVPPGKYRFAVGDKELGTNFSGGTLRSFVNHINDIDPDTLTARIIKTTNDAYTIIFESKKYGRENYLQFQDAALVFAQEHGIVASARIENFEDDNEYVLPGGSETSIPLNTDISPDTESTLSLTALLADTQPDSEALAGFELSPSGSVTVEGVTVRNLFSDVPITEQEAVIVDNSHPTFIYARFANGEEISLADISPNSEPQEIEVPIAKQSAPLDEIILRNENTHQTLTVSGISINSTDRGAYEALNAIERARDAIVKIDGVEVVRPSNIINDLIPQTTIELLAEKSQKIKAEIVPDYSNVKNSVLRFVGSYNQLIGELNILSRTDSVIIDELEFLSDEEREQAQERLGMLQGEITLSQLRTRLINLTQNPYPTVAGREVSLLSQLGIATNVGGFNSGAPNRSRLRGYLEFDESQFDAILQEQFQAVHELFGNDTDSDLVTDSGLAYEIDRYSRLYTQAGGIVQIRTEGLDNRIEQSNTQLANYNRQIEDYELRLRNEFGRMQGALNTFDETSQSLERLQQAP